MEENRYTTHRLMCCPHCGNPEPVYVTEYHKEFRLRTLCSLLNMTMIILCLSFFSKTVTSLEEIFKVIVVLFSGSIPIEIMILLFLMITKMVLKGIITYIESKTHVQAICRCCGNMWLLK